MERFWCWLAGFAVALVLVAGLTAVKSVVKELKERMETEMRVIAKEEIEKTVDYIEALLSAKKYCDRGPRRAEKEGENETD